MKTHLRAITTTRPSPAGGITGVRGAAFAAAVLLGGCGRPSATAGGQTGEEALGCRVVVATPLAAEKPSILGFSAEDALATMRGPRTVPFHRPTGTDTRLTITVMGDGSGSRFEDREWRGDDATAELATALHADCVDIVSIPARVIFETEDRAFAETWDVALSATQASLTSTTVDVDLSRLVGSYTVTEIDPRQYQEIRGYLNLEHDAGMPHGSLEGQATQISGSLASARSFTIGTF